MRAVGRAPRHQRRGRLARGWSWARLLSKLDAEDDGRGVSEMDLGSAVAGMTYPLAALSVGLVLIPLLFVVRRMVKASFRTRDLVFLGLLGMIVLIAGVGEHIGPWVTNLIYILAGVGR